MARFYKRSLLVALTSLAIVVPLGIAAGGEPISQTPGAQSGPSAMPQIPCAARIDVIKMLRERFGETPIAHGLATTGAVAEVFLGPKGNWTIVATSPNGVSCMVGSGESWHAQVTHDDTI
jgi:hypothetical protein